MTDREKTTLNALPRGLVQQTEADRPSGRRRPLLRRFAAALCLSVLGASLAGGAYYLLSRVEQEETPENVESELASFNGHAAPVLCTALAADGETVVSGDKAGQVLVWNGATRKLQAQFNRHMSSVGCVDISADGEMVAGGDDQGMVRIWNAKTGKQTSEFFAHGGGVLNLALYPTKQYLATCGRDGRLALWDLSEPTLMREYRFERAQINDLALTPDGLRIVAGDSAGFIRVLNLTAFEQVKAFQAHAGGVMRLVVAPQGGQILSGGKDGILRRWDLETGRVLGEWKPPASELIGDVAYSPGGTRALAVVEGGKIRLFSTEDDRLIETLGGEESPSSCGAFFAGGTLLVAGSPDNHVHFFRIPPPTTLEIECVRDVVESNQLLARKYESFGHHMKLGRSILDRNREREALKEFQLAESGVPKDSLEYQAAHDIVVDLSKNIEALERYGSLCRAGKQALDQEDLPAAMVRFGEAQKLIREIGLESKYPEARDGLEAAKRATALKTALDGLQVVDRGIDFVNYSTKSPFDHGRRFAFLLTKEVPPMALADTQLEWFVKITTPGPFPDEEVSLRVELYEAGTAKPIAAKDHPFVVGEVEQSFQSRASAPSGGWKPGTYELRTVLLSPRGKLNPNSREFKIGRLDWEERQVDLTPEGVQRAHFVVDAGLKIAKGEALYISASGTTKPAPTAFYRELLGDLHVAAPVPAEPEGLPWHKQAMRLQKYRTVDTKSNYAALLMRIGYESIWLPYKKGVPPLVMIQEGPLQLSINSIIPLSFSYAKPPNAWSVADRQYWAADGGKYDVTILHGRFDFPIPLSEIDKTKLLLRYFRDSDLSKSP
ncbi:MAG: hypothetical protein C0483_00270 [Pirellula sp.]|nr:hypothetical protein [Pirellula sp.]